MREGEQGGGHVKGRATLMRPPGQLLVGTDRRQAGAEDGPQGAGLGPVVARYPERVGNDHVHLVRLDTGPAQRKPHRAGVLVRITGTVRGGVRRVVGGTQPVTSP